MIERQCLVRRIRGCRLVNRAQSFEELDERGGFGRTQVLAVCRHVATPLKDLSDELIFRETCCYEVECGTTQPSDSANRMAVSALF